ncbi:MAG: 4Fe-4S binding protein, partial [Spongiibacteraceae bacterium]
MNDVEKTAPPAALKEIPVVQLAPAEVGEIDLYQKREKIYTRKIEGAFQKLRLYTGWPLLLGYFLLPWITWNGNPAVLFDLPDRKFHILNLTLWPQDFPLLAWLLIIAAFGLFTVTVWAGRVWCGYTCPQTVWTAIYMWAEQIAEGSRNQRIKLDAHPWSAAKILRKVFKHGMWLAFALLTGLTFIGYFSPIRELSWNLLTFDLSLTELAWITFFTCATYINAGWLREQVCLYMCPYAR